MYTHDITGFMVRNLVWNHLSPSSQIDSSFILVFLSEPFVQKSNNISGQVQKKIFLYNVFL